MATIENTVTSVGEDWEKVGPCTLPENVKWATLASDLEGPQRTTQSHHRTQKFYTYVYTKRNENMDPHETLYTNVHSSIVHSSQVTQMST
jgi:hypothetical protein